MSLGCSILDFIGSNVASNLHWFSYACKACCNNWASTFNSKGWAIHACMWPSHTPHPTSGWWKGGLLEGDFWPKKGCSTDKSQSRPQSCKNLRSYAFPLWCLHVRLGGAIYVHFLGGGEGQQSASRFFIPPLTDQKEQLPDKTKTHMVTPQFHPPGHPLETLIRWGFIVMVKHKYAQILGASKSSMGYGVGVMFLWFGVGGGAKTLH